LPGGSFSVKKDWRERMPRLDNWRSENLRVPLERCPTITFLHQSTMVPTFVRGPHGHVPNVPFITQKLSKWLVQPSI
jgi:hypothetical protein